MNVASFVGWETVADIRGLALTNRTTKEKDVDQKTANIKHLNNDSHNLSPFCKTKPSTNLQIGAVYSQTLFWESSNDSLFNYRCLHFGAPVDHSRTTLRVPRKAFWAKQNEKSNAMQPFSSKWSIIYISQSIKTPILYRACIPKVKKLVTPDTCRNLRRTYLNINHLSSDACWRMK